MLHKTIFLVTISTVFVYTQSSYEISIFGDVYQDTTFFTRTFPWIIDNIGGDITVEFYMLGSGRYTVPVMCALSQLRGNNFLKAQYLKCEAEGNPSTKCLCEASIDPESYKRCVKDGGALASTVSSEYTSLGLDVSPIVVLWNGNSIFNVDDIWYLKKICTLFGNNLPRGCTKPFSCNGTDVLSDKVGLANFDCDCIKCHDDHDDPTTTMPPTTTYPGGYMITECDESTTTSDYY